MLTIPLSQEFTSIYKQLQDNAYNTTLLRIHIHKQLQDNAYNTTLLRTHIHKQLKDNAYIPTLLTLIRRSENAT
jgi:hypothetical protein